jgi:hypothetical protein
MQFNLSLHYSIILCVLFSIMTMGNAGAASINFDSLQHSEIVKAQFPGVSISADNVGGGPDLAIIFDSRKRSTDFQDAVHANNTINRIQPITAANVSDFVGNRGLTKFDHVEINFAGSAAVDNIRLNPVPEPASMLLVGSGLIVLAGIGRKKFLNKKK